MSASVGAAVARAESLARRVGRRSLLAGILALGLAAAAWLLLLRPWVLDSWKAALAWSPLLLLLALPGLILLGFSRRVRRLVGLRSRLGSEIGGVAETEAENLTAATGGGIRSMLSALGDLRRHGGTAAAVARDLAGSARFLNPLYLALVALAAAGGIVVALAAAAGLVTLAL
jgi:hypothetical protein